MSFLKNYNELVKIVRNYFIKRKTSYDHGYEHALAVVANACRGLEHGSYTNDIQIIITAAALLHDVDDKKVAPESKDFQYAREFLAEAKYSTEFITQIIECIALASVNGNSKLPTEQQWKLVVRDANRLEAIGMIGMRRALAYTLNNNMYVILDTTPVVTNEQELSVIDMKARFEAYQKAGKSTSMFDHILDKLLVISQLSSGNQFMQMEANALLATTKQWYFAQCILYRDGLYANTSTKVAWFTT